jgi:hypothetical protein
MEISAAETWRCLEVGGFEFQFRSQLSRLSSRQPSALGTRYRSLPNLPAPFDQARIVANIASAADQGS